MPPYVMIGLLDYVNNSILILVDSLDSIPNSNNSPLHGTILIGRLFNMDTLSSMAVLFFCRVHKEVSLIFERRLV